MTSCATQKNWVKETPKVDSLQEKADKVSGIEIIAKGESFVKTREDGFVERQMFCLEIDKGIYKCERFK